MAQTPHGDILAAQTRLRMQNGALSIVFGARSTSKRIDNDDKLYSIIQFFKTGFSYLLSFQNCSDLTPIPPYGVRVSAFQLHTPLREYIHYTRKWIVHA